MAANYAVKKVFLSIRGEGSHAGRAAVFVRFGSSSAPKMITAAELIEKMNSAWPDYSAANRPMCVLIGNEPFLHVDGYLTEMLRAHGWYVAVETNGTIDPCFLAFDWITVSPKIGSNVHSGIFERASEVKVVLPGDVEGQPGWSAVDLEKMADRYATDRLFVQPQDGTGQVDALKQCISHAVKCPEWRVSLQLHKLMGLP